MGRESLSVRARFPGDLQGRGMAPGFDSRNALCSCMETDKKRGIRDELATLKAIRAHGGFKGGSVH